MQVEIGQNQDEQNGRVVFGAAFSPKHIQDDLLGLLTINYSTNEKSCLTDPIAR
ncbi:MAG: hypothetical protein ACPL3P_05385 [Anaerolineales bacterium]